MFTREYDKYNPIDIERHAKQLENHCLHEYIYKGNNTKIDINDIQPLKEKPLLMSGFSFDLLGLRGFEATRK